MYWKYHIRSGDAVEVTHDGKRGWGTVLGVIAPDDYDPDEVETADDVDLSRFDVKVKSGTKEVTVSMDDIHNYVKEEDRNTDLPHVSEEFRLTGGL